MSQIFNLILYQPLLNLLVFLYNTIGFNDLGLSIIFLTLIIKIILYPTSLWQIKAQKSLTELQPKLSELRKKYAHDKEKLSKEMIALYQKYKINPFSSCLPFIIQFPILIAVYYVFKNGILQENLPLYPFIHNPGKLNSIAFGFFDLSQKNFFLAFLTGAVQYFQSIYFSKRKTTEKKIETKSEILNKQMILIMSIFTVFIGASLPAGLVFYWLISLILTIFQQFLLFKKINL